MSLVLSIAFLSGVVRATGAPEAGARYFYCEAMGLMQSDPCAEAAHRGARGERGEPTNEIEEQHIDCCAVGTLPPMPGGALARAMTISAPPMLAAAWARASVAPSSASAPRFAARGHERWLPPPRPPGERRAALMVFLT